MTTKPVSSGRQSRVRPLREIRELIQQHLKGEPRSFHFEVMNSVSELLAAIERGDIVRVNTALSTLGIEPSNELHARVGNLTQGLHAALKELRDHLLRENYTIESTNIPEATDKLEKIIEMTFEAGEKTFYYMDLQTEALRRIKHEIDSLEAQMEADQGDLPRATALLFVAQQRELLQELAKTTLDIVIAQEYHDLTGQILKKVIKLLSDIERQLLSLVSFFTLEENRNLGEKSCEALDQGSADDLLKKAMQEQPA